jgi:hypothetical protein
MKIWFNGLIFENEDPNSEIYDDSTDAPSEDGANVDQIVTKKVDPEIAVKRVNLSDRLYANIIDFIRYNIGEVDQLNTIRENQKRIHDLFEELAHEVSSEYNAHKGREKEKVNVREDSTLRKINSMYRFFAYYVIKYDRQVVDWMEGLIRVGLFNDKSQIKTIDKSYSNIDLSLIFKLEPYELVPQSFYILHKDTIFNKTLDDFFKDSGDLVERLARGPGLFNDLSSMMVAFRSGITAEYYVKDEQGNKVKKRIAVPVGNTTETQQIIEAMLAIEAAVNSVINVDVIREKYVNDYKLSLQKLNLTQEQIAGQLKILRDEIKGGKINTVEDFNKIQNQYKKIASSDKEKEELGNRTSRMATAYKYKVESVLNNQRGF